MEEQLARIRNKRKRGRALCDDNKRASKSKGRQAKRARRQLQRVEARSQKQKKSKLSRCLALNIRGRRCKSKVEVNRHCKIHQYQDPASNLVQCRGINKRFEQCVKSVKKNDIFCAQHGRDHSRLLHGLAEKRKSTSVNQIFHGQVFRCLSFSLKSRRMEQNKEYEVLIDRDQEKLVKQTMSFSKFRTTTYK